MGAGSHWNGRNVLVTGCTGLLGSWLTKDLVEQGARVIGLVRDQVRDSNLYGVGIDDKITRVSGTLEDYGLLERVINEYEVEVVFHLAAQTIVGTANRNPLSTFDSNVRGTWHLLEACRRSRTAGAIIVASSDKAYGRHEVLPYREEFALRGEHPYDVSKSCADLIARSFFTTYGTPVCITRCGNIYGGGDFNFSRIVPGTIRSVLRNEKPVIRSDGSFVRDYIYVLDVVRAYLLLGERMVNAEIHGEAFNLSNEQPCTVIDLVNRILRLMKREDLAPTVLNEAKDEIRLQYLSSGKAREILGWRPEYSLEDGLSATIAWYRRNGDGIQGTRASRGTGERESSRR